MCVKHRAPKVPASLSDPEAGGALAFVLIIAAAMLFVGAIGMHASMSGRRAATHSREAREAFTCAERGLEMGRTIAGANLWEWNQVLADTDTAWYDATGGGGIIFAAPYTEDCGTTGVFTHRVRMRDDIDEYPPAVNDEANDTNLRVILESEAISGGIPRARVTAVVGVPSAMLGDYKHQSRDGASKPGNVGNQ